MAKPYPYTLWINFNSTNDNLPTLDEFEWMTIQQTAFNEILPRDIGYCDGSGGGIGNLDVYFFVSDVQAAFQIVLDYLTDHELIGYCNYISTYGGDMDRQILFNRGNDGFEIVDAPDSN